MTPLDTPFTQNGVKGVHERNKSCIRCQLQTLGEASRTHTCFALIHVHTKQKQTTFTVCEVTALLLADSCPCVKKALAFIIFMENMTWATRHVNNLCHNGHFERSQVHTPCAPYPFARGTLAFSLSTTQTRVRAQSVLLIVSPFNHHWQRKRAVAGAKWCDEWRGEGAGREGGVKEKDEGDDILKLAGCAKVTDDLMLVVTLLCHRNQVICQTPLSSPPLSSRFHLFRLCLSSPRVSSPAEKYPNYFLFWISHWPTDLAEKMKLSSQHFH